MVVKRPSLGYQALIGLVGLFMLSTVLDSVAEFWRLDLPGSRLILFALAGIGFAWAWWRSPWLGGGLTALSAVGAVAGFIYLPTWRGYLFRLQQDAAELWAHLRVGELETTFSQALGVVMILGLAILAGTLIMWEGLSRGKAFWSIVGGVLLFGSQWAWFFDKSASFFMGFMLFALVLWTLAQAAQRDAYWASTGRRVGYQSHVATPLVAVFVASLAGSIMPYEFAPVHLGEIGVKIQEAFPVLKQLRGGGAGGSGGRFSLAATGFSPGGVTLGGPVQLDETVALYLTPDRPLNETFYLRGATFLEYTGRSWLPGESQQIEIAADGTLPTGYAPDVLRDYRSFKLSPVLGFGRTVFNLLEPMRVDGLASDYTVDADNNLYATRSIAKESTYTVSARLPIYSGQQIRLLAKPDAATSAEAYLQLPDDLPDRVSQLAGRITSGAEHPYDKALALEGYLRGLTYDLGAPAAPAGQDFVDFFLFDLQRGYCTYFATAMVVMLRDQGIPSRLVEGFAVPYSTEFTEDGQGARTYPVLNSQAHAWVEAYFPGYGWITFDPTPRADLPVIDRSATAPDPTTPDLGENTEEIPELNDTPNEENFDEPTTDLGSATATPVAREWPWFLTPLLVLGALAFVAYRYLSRQDRLASSEARTLVQEVWEKTGGLLDRFDFGRSPNQTAREYAATLGNAFPSMREPVMKAAEDYTAARYSPAERPLDTEAGERAKSFWSRAHEELFNRYGWRTYLWRRLWRSRKQK